MHTYVHITTTGRWEVRFYFPHGAAFQMVRRYDTEAQAAAFASFLNGGKLPDNAAYGSPP